MRSWADVGIVLPYGATGEVRTLCPRCSSRRRKSQEACLAVHIEKKVWRCWHCGWCGGLRGSQTFQRHSVPPPPQPDARKRAALRRIWRESLRITVDDPVYRYLHRRGLNFGHAANIPAILRYHPHLLYVHNDGRKAYYPAMLARVDNPQGQAVSLHRTYLTHDGQKAPVSPVKKLMAPLQPGATRGGAIRLYPAEATLAVTEGIETALAVRLATKLSVWAAISAKGMAALVVPETVHTIVICADHDATGLHSARTLAQRLLVAQRTVKLLSTEAPGTDWADMLGRSYA